MVDTVIVRGLLRFFAGTVVLAHNITFSAWRRASVDQDHLAEILKDDRAFLEGATTDILGLCKEIGCSLPGDFMGLSKFSSIPVGSCVETQALRTRFRKDHTQMADDAAFLLKVVPFETLPISKPILSQHSAAHDIWSRRWG
ncbi:hypothetical protein [Roseibium sp. MMSF_3412]|uniref:hypothetical protein n=1 Tax=Roseibium sp. MMSF_3412 TaxID=3046712 RepID=UPI00273FE715|nr:hypothetical protein [Roseibium sp. MMSF_3412]